MSCLHCAATFQRGRFCNRCGKRLLAAAGVERRMPLTRRLMPREGERQQPGGQGRDVTPGAPDRSPSRTAAGHRNQARGRDTATAHPAAVRRMYDTAMERAAVHSRPSLQRYLSVLLPAQ
jgi:hypothetical protein